MLEPLEKKAPRVTRQPLTDAFEVHRNPDADDKRPITLIRPTTIFSAKSYSAPLTPPIGIAYIASSLEKAGYVAKLVDCVGEGIDQIRLSDNGRFKIQGLEDSAALDLVDPKSDILGVSIMFSQEWPHIRRFITKLRERFPNATIVAGGEHPTAMPEYTLNDCPAIDYLVTGEGELALLELVHALRSKGPVDGVSGVVYRENDEVKMTRLSQRMLKVDDLPWPAWHLMDLEPYFQPNYTMGISHGRNMGMVATRGCPYQCTFCSNPLMWTTRYVMRPPADVVDEMEFNIKTYDANSIDFFDLTAVVKKQWILDFAEELVNRKIDVSWQLPSGTRSEALDEEVLEAVKTAGLDFIVYAPESGSERILKSIKKKVKLDRLVDSVKAAKQQDLVVKVNFIIGFPDETRRDILKTLFFAWKLALLKADDCNISTFSPYPGSELFDGLRDEGVIGKPDDAFFENLVTQFDFTIAKTVCRNVGPLEMLLYRVTGMGLFYALTYLRSPLRGLRLLKLMFRRNRDFAPDTLFEQRVFDAVSRA
jgi:radical SAM superfamily enzyme YgiQ (UPF0313 family)